MAASSGNGGVLQTSPDDSTYSAIASLQSWTLEQAADTIETSAMGTALGKTFIPGQTSFSGSADALWNDDDTSMESIQTGLAAGDIEINNLAQDSYLSGVEITLSGDGSTGIGKIAHSYTVVYQNAENAPDAAL